MTPTRTSHGESHPYLRAASAGLRHHTKTHQASADETVDRSHLDLLHAHLIGCHQLLDQLNTATTHASPTAGRSLATARARLWQAAASVHEAFHALPLTDPAGTPEACAPDRLLDGPPFVTICHRHLAAVHTVRRTTTPSDLRVPPPDPIAACVQ